MKRLEKNRRFCEHYGGSVSFEFDIKTAYPAVERARLAMARRYKEDKPGFDPLVDEIRQRRSDVRRVERDERSLDRLRCKYGLDIGPEANEKLREAKEGSAKAVLDCIIENRDYVLNHAVEVVKAIGS